MRVVGDEGEGYKADPEELRELVQERSRDTLDIHAPRHLVGHPADALELLRREGALLFTRAPTTENRTQDQGCGRDAAERADGRKLLRSPHWAPRLYEADAPAAREFRLQTWKSPPLGGSVRRALPIAPRESSEDAAVRIAQWQGG